MNFKIIKTPVSIKIPTPDDEMTFFEDFKKISELYWDKIQLKAGVYGYQIQCGSRWKKGLEDAELLKFEEAMGYPFPEPLKRFYSNMNGLDRPEINISGESPVFEPKFYSFPDDLDLIMEMIDWIYKRNSISHSEILTSGISWIFPVYAHRFMMIDIPGNPILSMWGDDIIYWTDSISKLLIKDIFADKLDLAGDQKLRQSQREIKFWLDDF